MPFTPYRGEYLTSGTTALYRQRPRYIYCYISRKNSGTFSRNVHTLPSLEGPNLGQTPQMKVIRIWPVRRGSDSKILSLTVLLRPADLLNKKIRNCCLSCHLSSWGCLVDVKFPKRLTEASMRFNLISSTSTQTELSCQVEDGGFTMQASKCFISSRVMPFVNEGVKK